MPKEINLEKVKDIFKKADVDHQFEAYWELGKFIIQNISQDQEKIAQKLNELQAKKEAIKKD